MWFIVMCDIEGIFVATNSVFLSLLGFSPVKVRKLLHCSVSTVGFETPGRSVMSPCIEMIWFTFLIELLFKDFRKRSWWQGAGRHGHNIQNSHLTDMFQQVYSHLCLTECIHSTVSGFFSSLENCLEIGKSGQVQTFGLDCFHIRHLALNEASSAL